MTSLNTITWHQATATDWPEVAQLLTTAELPLNGAREHLSDFIVARHADGRLAAVAGLERYEKAALLRSVAVAERGNGLGQAIVSRIISHAGQSGIRQIVLLTTTAADFFPRFGFRRIERSEAPCAAIR